MGRKRKVLTGVVAVLALVAGAGAFWLSHDSACPGAPPPAAGGDTFRAQVYRCYGGPEVLHLEQLAKPVPAVDQLLVHVQAASVNPLDWHYLHGEPYFMRFEVGTGAPRDTRLGTDFSGTVVAVGSAVTKYKVGDEVFGGTDGAFGEYILVRESRAVAAKPAGLSHADVAALPIAASTALQALRDHGHLGADQSVLINGASGGVGTYAVQIAKLLGAKVTAVCGARNMDLVRSLGADQVIDYAQTDVTQGKERYDLIVDTVSSHELSEYRRILTDHGTLVIVGSLDKGRWLGGLGRAISAKLRSSDQGQRMGFMLAALNHDDLAWLADQLAAGRLRSVIDRHYPLADTAAALAYVEAGHARGKVIIDIN